MNLNDWFNKGISTEAYLNDLTNLRDNFYTVYNQFEVPEEDKGGLKEASGIRVIALSEVWCAHCMMDVAVLLNILEEADIPVSFLPRDEHLELMDQYTTNDKRIIPIFIFIDDQGNEQSTWGPWAPEVKELVDDMKQDLPPKDDPQYQEAFRPFAKKITERFTNEATYWMPTYQSILGAMPM